MIAPLNYDSVVTAMLRCEQTAGQTVYQHGVSVKNHFDELRYALENSVELPNWRIPACIEKNKKLILDNLPEDEIHSSYMLMHDCGKPFCRTVDADGKVHFPDHAKVSKEIFESIGGNPCAADYIGWDMVLHTASADEIDEYMRTLWNVPDACTLMLVALSEVHSNARMFGGIESVSFKSKAKTIERRAKQICRFYFGE